MQKLYAAVIGIDQGDETLFSDFEREGPMWAGDGHREVAKFIKFSEPFKDVPSVSTGLSLFDFSNKANIRFEMAAENVSTEGFRLVFKTWGDTKIARVRASWTAIGPVRGEGDWEV